MGAAGLADLVSLAAEENYLVVVSTARADGSIQSSVVNAGPVAHPLDGSPALAFVTYGPAKLAHLRARPWADRHRPARLALGGRRGHRPDHRPGRPGAGGRRGAAAREIFAAAGGTHDDWDGYDAEMRAQGRAAVLLTPTRVYSN